MKVVRERDATFVPRKFVAGRGCLLHFLCPARVLAIAGCVTKLREQLPKHVNNPHPEEEAECSSSELIPTAESQDDTAEPVKELPPDP